MMNRRLPRTLTAMLLLVVFAASLLFLPSLTAAAVTAPSASDIYVYNNNSSSKRMPAVYIMMDRCDPSVSYRVYSANKTTLLGEAQADAYGSYCVVTLSTRPTADTYLFVSRVEDGVESSKTRVTAPARVNPAVSLTMNQLDAAKPIPKESYSESPGFEGSTTYYSSIPLTKGSFYQAEIAFTGAFTAIDTVTIPLRYDTTKLRPARIAASGSSAYVKSALDNAITNAKSGINFAVPSVNSNSYGITTGYGFSEWGAAEGLQPGFSAATSNGSYQYINTTTGLIKLEASVAEPAAFPGASKKTEFVRIFFEALEDVTLDSLPVWFATEADCPDEYINSDTLKVRYYDTASPNGIAVRLGGANVLASPPSVEAAEFYSEASPLTLAAEDLSALPESYSEANSSVVLEANQVKVYNYTNTSSNVNGLGSIDYGTNDRMVIKPSTLATSTIRSGDTIKIYKSGGTGYELLISAVMGSDETSIDLGVDKLSENGGTLYISVLRSGQESDKVPVEYPREVSRDVTFRIYRSGWAENHAVGDYDYNDALLDDVSMGERLQLRIYFNNFYDLMSYGFAIGFNPSVIQVADASYNKAPDGTVLEEDFKAGTTAFSVGADLANVTLTEQVIYHAWRNYEEALASGDSDAMTSANNEIIELMVQLGMTSSTSFAEFEQIAKDVEVKYSVGAPEGSDIPWKGGLLFTGPATAENGREATSTYPYIDNKSGYLQLLSASLVNSPLTLEREDDGYHFLSINFIATANAGPGLQPNLRLVTDADPANCAALPKGYQVGLVGGGSLAGGNDEVGITESWKVYPMSLDPELTLSDGNAKPEDLTSLDSTALFLYNGAAFRDPGFKAAMSDGTEIPMANVKRYFLASDGSKVELPAYEADEALDTFTVRDGKYSDEYTLIYEYTTSGGKTARAERKIYVIFKKGDTNRDGAISLFDEQILANHLNNTTSLSTDELYRSKTADVNGDGSITPDDRELLRKNSLGLVTITQDYAMPVA